jgi:hypothetical protein
MGWHILVKTFIEQSINSNVALFAFPHNPLISLFNQIHIPSVIFIAMSQCNRGKRVHERTYNCSR